MVCNTAVCMPGKVGGTINTQITFCSEFPSELPFGVFLFPDPELAFSKLFHYDWRSLTSV